MQEENLAFELEKKEQELLHYKMKFLLNWVTLFFH